MSWYKDAVIYQIYPWSFKDSNNDGIGDIRGIISKLDYLKDLGIDAVWISPIYPSPMKDFGYDVSDYCNIDPRFGTLEDFDRLASEAKKRGIKIIMDLVTNHTSIDHPWFMESRSSKDNPKRDWYVWHDGKPDGQPPTNWLAVSGGSAWTKDPVTSQYYLHQFLPDQPDLNWRNPEVRDAMRDVIHFWLKRGVDGFRVDAMNHFVEDEKFRDEPYNPHYREGAPLSDPYQQLVHKHSQNQPESLEIINFICESAAEIKETFVVTEFYVSLAQLANIYRSSKYKSHAPFNFSLLHISWSVRSFKNFIDKFDELVGNEYMPTYVFGNHDNSRLLSRLADPIRARICAMMLFTLRGIPFIYYGEEIGMSDSVIPPNLTKDGFATLSPKPAISRDPERTPMQWSKEKYAGFSEYTPWLPVAANYESVNAEVEKNDPESLYSLYKALIHLRKNTPTLLYGSYKSLPTRSPNVFYYVREHENKRIYVMLNFTGETIHEPHIFADIKVLSSTYMNIELQNPAKEIVLRPNEGIVFVGN